MTEVIRGRYRLIDKLGQGGFGAVWRAHDETLNREVAVKVLNLANENQEEMVARFKTESQVASSFEHPNILRVYDFGQDENGRCFLVSELLKGTSLHDELKPKEPLSLELTLDVLYQVGSALEVAHNQKTVHRDIKPPNIFLNQPMKGPGYVKLLDFGIAKVMGGKQESLTVTGQIMGTPHYMSPEQIVNIKLVDHRSDIYSLGIVFYQMLTGVVPFDDESYFAIMRHQMQSPMPKLDLPQYSSELVNEFQEILKLMTHKDVRKRVSSMQDILGRIEQVWQAYSISSNAMSTGSFRAISTLNTPATQLKLNQVKANKAQNDQGLEQMLNLAEDQNADALIDHLFASDQPDEHAKEKLDERSPHHSSPHKVQAEENRGQTEASNALISSEDTQEPESLLDASQTKSESSAQEKQIQEKQVQEKQVQEKQVQSIETTSATQALKALPKRSSNQNILLGIVIVIVAFVIWIVFLKNEQTHVEDQSPQHAQIQQEIQQDQMIQTDADMAVADMAVADMAVADMAVADMAVADMAVADMAVADMAVADMAVADMAVADMASTLNKSAEKQTKTQPTHKVSTKQKWVKRKKPNSSNKRTQKRSKAQKTKLKGRIRIIPDGVSYDVGQKVKLKLPSSVKGLNVDIDLGSCARWISKSQNRIEFNQTGKCTIKACHGKDCIKSSVINVTKPLF